MKKKLITKIKTPIGVIKKIEPKKNRLNIIKKTSKQYKKRKTFNICFYDFGLTLSDGINSFTKNIKYKDNLKKEELDCLNNIKNIANKKIDTLNKEDKVKYLNSITKISKDLEKEISLDIGGIIVPVSGGNIIANSLEIEKSKIIPINCKRVQLKEKNCLGLGMNIDLLKKHKNSKVKNWYLKKIRSLENKEVVFLEVSVASGLTTISFLLELITNNIKPKKIKLLTPFSSIKGVENIEKFSKYFNIKLEIKSKVFLEKLGDYWSGTEDSILDNDGKFLIGQTTKILK